jgi:hypothetical protein
MLAGRPTSSLQDDVTAAGAQPDWAKFPDRLECRMGCLFAIVAGAFPRLAFLIYWIARPGKVDAAFDTFLLPLLGFIFLPFTTLMYAILYTPGVGLVGWEWFWIFLAALLDIGHWGATATQRGRVTGMRRT